MSDRARPPVLALFLAALIAGTSISVPAAAYRARHAIIVVVDGARLSETFEDPTHQYVPHTWNELVPIGTRFPEFHNDGLTETVSGHASIVTGTWQSLPDNGSVRPSQPTVFEYYRAHTGAPEQRAWIVGGKYKLNACSYSTHPFYGSAYRASADNFTRPDEYTYNEFKQELANHAPTIALLSLSQVDVEGHDGNWERYTASIATTDSILIDLWNWLEDQPDFAGRTALFLVNDHGRHLVDWTGHGDSCLGCVRLNFLALGPDFFRGAVVGDLGQMIDICPTIADLFGFPAPQATGRSLLRQLVGIDMDLATPPAGALAIEEVALAPNPFNPLLRIQVDLRRSAPLAIDVCDVQGRRVRALWRGMAGPGAHAVTWDGRGDGGRPQGGGWYAIVVRSDDEVITERAVLVK